MKRFSKSILLTVLVISTAFAVVGCKSAAVAVEPEIVDVSKEESSAVIETAVEDTLATEVVQIEEAPATEPKDDIGDGYAEAEAEPIVRAIDLFGYHATIEYADKVATITYPSFITNEEVLTAAKAAYAAYGPYLAGTELKVDDGTAVLTFPYDLTEADVDYVVALLNAELPAYVASLFAEPEAEEPVVEEAPVVEEVAVAAEPNKFYKEIALYGYKATFDYEDKVAKITYPSIVTNAEAIEATKIVFANYGAYFVDTTIAVDHGKATMTFPVDISEADFDAVVDILKRELPAFISASLTGTKYVATDPAPAPVAEEVAVVAEEPVVEEAPVVEEVKAEPISRTIEFLGYKATIEYADKVANITYPSFVTNEEVLTAAKAAYAAYGPYLAGTDLKVDNGTAVLTFPYDLTEADVDYVVALLNAELPVYIASLFAEPEAEEVAFVAEEPVVEETPVVEAPVVEEPVVEEVKAEPISRTIEFLGYKATIEYADKVANITYPSFVTNEEAITAAKAAYAAYAPYLAGTDLKVDNGTAVLTFPYDLTEADVDYVVALLNAELPVYIASLFAEPEAEEVAVVAEEPVVEAAPVVEAPVVEEVKAEPIVRTVEFFGYKATIEYADKVATITYPSIVTNEEAIAAAKAAYAAYAPYLAGTELTIQSGTAVLEFPYDLTEADVDYVVSLLKAEIPAYIASLITQAVPEAEEVAVVAAEPVVEETPVVEAPVVEEPVVEEVKAEPIYRTVEFLGHIATIKYENKVAEIAYPPQITKSEVAQAARYAYEAYAPYLEGTTLSIKDGGTAVLTFPNDLTEADVDYVVALLNAELPAYVASVIASAEPEVEEIAVVAAEPVVEEKPVVEEAPVVEEKPVVVETPVVEEKPVVVETPVVEEKPVVEEAPVVEETPVVEKTPVVEETPVVEPAAKKSSGGLIAVIVILVIAACAAAYILLKKKK